MDLTRRELLTTAATAAATVIAACGGDDDAPAIDATPPNCLANGTRATITYNHGHTIDITAADIAAGNQRSYDITGTADHSHSVSVSAADMTTLAGNGPIQVTSSSTNGHTHIVNVFCR
jgi:hypothetical protein